MRDVVRQTQALTARGTEAGDRGVQDATWESTTRLPWSLWPAAARALAPTDDVVVAHEQTCPWSGVLLDGTEHTTAVTWRAYPSGLFVARAAMPRAGTDGLDGSPRWVWRHLDHTWAAATRPPTLTRGLVPSAVSQALGATRPRSTSPTPEGRTAAGTHALLPHAVREGLERVVPHPELWLGQATQETTADDGVLFTVSSMRAQTDRAVVVVATKSLPADKGDGDQVAWDVTQVTYELTPSAWALDAGSGPAQLPFR